MKSAAPATRGTLRHSSSPLATSSAVMYASRSFAPPMRLAWPWLTNSVEPTSWAQIARCSPSARSAGGPA